MKSDYTVAFFGNQSLKAMEAVDSASEGTVTWEYQGSGDSLMAMDVELDIDEVAEWCADATKEFPNSGVRIFEKGSYDWDGHNICYVAGGRSFDADDAAEDLLSQDEIFETLRSGREVTVPTPTTLVVVSGALAAEFSARVLSTYPAFKNSKQLESSETQVLLQLENRPYLDGNLRATISELSKAFPEKSFLTRSFMEDQRGAWPSVTAERSAHNVLLKHMSGMTAEVKTPDQSQGL